MITVPKLELQLTNVCNLRCAGCTHYANYQLSGVLALDEGERWLRPWSARIAPLHVSLLGGEPLLNDELPGFLQLTRALWPDAQLRLVSNGLLLGRWGTTLWPVLAETRTRLTISIHSRDPVYVARLAPVLAEARAQAARHGVALEERNSIDGWYRPYRGEAAAMEPFDDRRPAESWKVCQSKHCVTLHDGQLWKCPPLAHLPKVAARFRLDAKPAWQPYLAYQPLRSDASDDEIRAFYARGPEAACGMCPARLDYFEKPVF